MTLERPMFPPRAEPADALYRRANISPDQFFQALGRVRREVRDEIERLIDWLDATTDTNQDAMVDDAPIDGDPDAEPSMGSFDRMSDQIKAWQTRPVNFDVDAELDPADHVFCGGALKPRQVGRQAAGRVRP